MIKAKILITFLLTMLHLGTDIGQSFGATVATSVNNASLGMTVGQLYDSRRKDHKGRIVVLDLVLRGPAQLAGIEKGDIITHIDGKATKGRNVEQVIPLLLKGRPGTLVDLKIYRTDPVRLIDIKVKRERIEYQKNENAH